MKKERQNIILIVDDNPTNLGALFKFLSDYGFKVLVAIDGESAIEQIEYVRPDIILLDVMMPGIDGFEACRRLKASPEMQDIPVIFLTALSDTVDKVKGFNVGGVDYITKPINQEEVLSRVKSHLTISYLQNKLLEKNQELLSLNENLEKLVERKTKQLIEQEKSAIIGRLAQGMVHNLKNHLQTILLCSNFIEARAKEITEEAIAEDIQYVQAAGERIQEIMDNLVQKSIMEKKIDLQPINLNELLQGELKLLEANTQFKHKIKKHYFFDDRLPRVPLIYGNISQVFHNLVNNAIDAMWNQKERELTIATRQDDGKIYMDIKDTGCGIKPDNFTKIFEIFYTSKPPQTVNKKSEEPTGTGLGLYTCVELLKPFNGKIEVSSLIGKGSTFTVVLPKISREGEHNK
ncbi:MAG: response regulator [Cyanobacteriota bacterium]|nr:response regulator [Cyanobacteriota bacterium]